MKWMITSLLGVAVLTSLAFAGAIDGKAIYPGGQPVVNAWVKLYDSACEYLDETTANSQGEFFFGDLDPGNYIVYAKETDGSRWGWEGCAVVGSDTTEIEVEVEDNPPSWPCE